MLWREPELRGAAMQLLDNSVAVLLLILVGTRIPVVHAEAHGVVEQHRDLARGCSHCLGIANAGRKTSIEGAQGGMASSHRDRC
jgi:hypothetical protein